MKVLLADDHDLIRQGIKLVLNKYNKYAKILESTNFTNTLTTVKNNLDLDLIILDLFMPGSSSTQTIKILRHEAPSIPIIMLSSSEDIEHIKSALEFGANGYIPKSSPNEIFYSAIELVMSGGIYIPQQALNPDRDHDSTIESALTERQTEALQLLAKGKSNKEIARMMNITEHTVKSHITIILNHLNAKNRTQAVLHAQQAGMISSLQKP